MDCFGDYYKYLKCYYCSMKQECKTAKYGKDDTMYMEITITKPAETQAMSATTLEELQEKEMRLETDKANIAAQILHHVENEKYDAVKFCGKEYREVCKDLNAVRQDIANITAEQKLLADFKHVLENEALAKYQWVEAYLSGDVEREKAINKDIRGMEDARLDALDKIQKHHDRKFYK